MFRLTGDVHLEFLPNSPTLNLIVKSKTREHVEFRKFNSRLLTYKDDIASDWYW